MKARRDKTRTNQRSARSNGCDIEGNGAPGKIRTPDPQIRSLVLYPAELRARESGRTLLKSPKRRKRREELDAGDGMTGAGGRPGEATAGAGRFGGTHWRKWEILLVSGPSCGYYPPIF